ncbi:hypothetical protein H0X10_00125 [Candidatus Saccharibacteria bacterium]|nr:hypothetical protein [Candidatus Saccharibacteria bacterium]
MNCIKQIIGHEDKFRMLAILGLAAVVLLLSFVSLSTGHGHGQSYKDTNHHQNK